MRLSKFPLLVVLLLICAADAAAADFTDALSGMEKRYSAVDTASGSFKQVYRSPGITLEETGVFQLKRPGLMRWEYRTPEKKLFVADGKECFLYVPLDRQVTIAPLTPSDLARTPISFLLGGGNVRRDYSTAAETEFKPAFPDTIMLRLTPVRNDSEYVFVTLELDGKTYDIRRVIIRGNGETSEYHLSDVVLNQKIDAKSFQFKTPKGVEEVRMQD